MDLCDKIKQLRTQKEMTLEDVAKIVGVSASTIMRYENGNIKNLRRDKIKKLADALSTTPAYLMGWTDIAEIEENSKSKINPQYKIDEKKLLREFQKLNYIGRTKAIEWVAEVAENPKYTLSTEELNESHISEICTPIAAHNDNADDEEQLRLMRKDLDEL